MGSVAQDPTLAAGLASTWFSLPSSSQAFGALSQVWLGITQLECCVSAVRLPGLHPHEGPGAAASQQLQSPLLAITAVDLEQTGLSCGF